MREADAERCRRDADIDRQVYARRTVHIGNTSRKCPVRRGSGRMHAQTDGAQKRLTRPPRPHPFSSSPLCPTSDCMKRGVGNGDFEVQAGYFGARHPPRRSHKARLPICGLCIESFISCSLCIESCLSCGSSLYVTCPTPTSFPGHVLVRTLRLPASCVMYLPRCLRGALWSIMYMSFCRSVIYIARGAIGGVATGRGAQGDDLTQRAFQCSE